MSKNITLMGASYSAVPAVTLPKTGGGTATFYDVDGSQIFTENGTYDVSALAEAVVNVSGGGGDSNVVIGEFTTGSSTGTTGSVSVPYTGSGFPIAAMVFVAGGMVNNTETGNTDWYNSVHRYAVGQWTYHNTQQASSCNTGVTTWVFKNSTSNSQSYSRSSAINTSVRTSSAPSGAGATCVRMTTDGKTLKWYVSSSSYGLLASTKYTYIIIYSS